MSVTPDELEGMDIWQRAHIAGEDAPPSSLDRLAEDRKRRIADEARSEQIRAGRKPRVPRTPDRGEPLSFPDRASWEVVGSREATAALDGLRLQLNRHCAGLPKARRKRIETAVADLEAAVAGRGR